MGWGEGPEGGSGLAIQGYWYSKFSLMGSCSHCPPSPISIRRTAETKPGSFRPADYSPSHNGSPSYFLPIASYGMSLFLTPGGGPGGRDALGEYIQTNGREDIQDTRQIDGQNSGSWTELWTSEQSWMGGPAGQKIDFQ